MAVVSLGAGLFALLLTLGGFLFTLVPGVGSLFSFAAPFVALAGIITGGLAQSEAKRRGESASLARSGLIVSIVAALPAFVVAVSCGLCNACATVGTFESHGVSNKPRPPVLVGPDPAQKTTHPRADAAPPPAGAPPPAFPPPPMGGADIPPREAPSTPQSPK